MGGGGGTTTTNPPIRQDIPLQQAFVNLGTDSILYHAPYNTFGAGYQLANRSPFGQVYTPGPNQTLFGNPYTTAGHQPYFGQAAAAPTNYGFQNYGAANKMGGYNPAPIGQLPGGRAYPGSQGMQQFYQAQMPPQGMGGQGAPQQNSGGMG